MSNKKITVITFQNVSNYGSVLQAFATQEVFRSLGCEVNFINYYRKDFINPIALIREWCRGLSLLKKVVYPCLLYPSFLRLGKVLGRFRNKHLNVLLGVYSTEKDFERFPITSDIYCTGSDKTWNSGWNQGILPPLFLSFVPDSVPKIAYSASFGKQQLDEWEKAETRKWLKRYRAISVRESSGVDICRDLGIDHAVHVLDPTLQLDRSFWQQYAGERKQKKPYVLIYQLNTNPQFDRYAAEYARRKQLQLVRFCTRWDQVVKVGKAWPVPEVTDFINAILYADTVITDSFHATAFSLNLHTPMICIYPHKYGGRLDSILKLTGLEHRHLTSYDDFSFVDAPPIDFDKVETVLEQEREKGWKFLKQAIS